MDLTRRTFLAGMTALSLLLAGCARTDGTTPAQPSGEDVQQSFFCFDTACAIGGVMTQDLLDAAVSRCQGFEATLSRTIATSDVGRVNAAAGAPVEVERETAELIERSLVYCEASEGLFDITIGAVSQLWDFRTGVVPSEEQLAAAIPHVDYRCVRVEGTTVTLDDPKAALDLGGIAKGYVADVLLDELAAAGVKSAYVNLGGNVKVLGAKPDGSPWQVGVRDPNAGADATSSIARVALTGGSVVTSGLYERQFEAQGRRWWHILDPRTGYPVETDLTSATVVSERSIDGDGYTKPLFMWGTEASLAWAEQRDDLQVLLVDETGSIEMRPQDSFELL